MNDIRSIGSAAQPQPPTTNAVAAFNDAIRNALFALDGAIVHLEKVSRLAGEVGNPRERELAGYANDLRSAFDTAQLVEMYFVELFPKQ